MNYYFVTLYNIVFCTQNGKDQNVDEPMNLGPSEKPQ